MKVKEIIRSRDVAILSHGRSIYELEDYIKKLKNYDICWTSSGVFPMMEKYLLSKIDKKLEIVFDPASVSESKIEAYETIMRLPRIWNFLSRKENNLWITSHGIIRDSVNRFVPEWLKEESIKNKIEIVDDYVHPDIRPQFMDVPNTIALMLGAMIAGGAKRIFLFGLDGYKGNDECPPISYYHPEEIIKERKYAIGSKNDPGINRDTRNLERTFRQKIDFYKDIFNSNVEIINVSPVSVYDAIPKINYSQLEEFLNGEDIYYM